MRRFALILAVVGAAAHAALAQQPPALTLEAAEGQAVAANKTIAAARLTRPVDQAAIDVARERPNPDISFESNRETPRQSINGSLPIELGGKRQSRINLATAAAATGEAEVERVIAGIRNDVRRAYFALVAADRRVALAVELQTLMGRARDTAQARFQAGDVAQMDVVQAEMVFDDAANQVTAMRGEATAARAELNTLLGQAPGTPLTLADDFTATPLPPEAAVLTQAAAENADLRVLDRQLAEQTARRDVAKSMQTPDLTAGAGLAVNAAPEFNYGWRTSLTMTVPLFTQHKAGVALEDAELARLGAAREAVLSEIAGAVSAALARAAAARDQVDLFQSHILPHALDLQQKQEDAYRSGQTPIGTYLQALQDARDVRARGLEAGLAYQLALADLERAIGASIK
jgi:cobalt-zinc-cadmium efflux system outer membrane protein